MADKDIVWGERLPGSDTQVGPSGDGGHVVVSGVVPDWVKLPPELGGTKVRVTSVEQTACVCGKHPTRKFNLENGLAVFECGQQYLWCRPRPGGKT